MKNLLNAILLLCWFSTSFAQLLISSGTEIYVAEDNGIYTNEDLNNEGTLSFKPLKAINFIVDAGLDNSQGTINFNDASLLIGSGGSNASSTDNFVFNTNDIVRYVILDKTSGTTIVTNGHLGITETLKLESGTLNAGNKVTLLNPSTSEVAQVIESTGGSANVRVERFIPVATALPDPTRGFRFLASSVDSNGSIYNNWQESGNSPAGYGTHITGNNDGTNGVDQTITGNPSMYNFDNALTGNQNNAWVPVTDTKGIDLKAGKAYRIFIRGDRNYNLDSNPADAPNSDVTLRATGALVVGDKTETLSNVGGFYSSIGNPYQANVNINNVTGTNLNTNFYWVWDPNMSQRGAYVAVPLPIGNPIGSSDVDQFIQPGQSFFVQTLNDGIADLTFTETAKDVAALPTNVFSDDDQISINLLLYTDQSLNNNDIEADALGINFSPNGNNTVDQMDAGKLGNPDENLARLNNGAYLSIENRAMPVDNESLVLFTNGYTASNYTFVANASNLPNDVDAFLVDNYTGNQTLLSDGNNQINFTVDASIPESIAADRFSVDFEVETFGLNDNDLAEIFTVYPNPVTESPLTIISSQMAGENVELNLYNMIGQSLLQTQGTFESNGELKLNLGSYEAGVYLIEVNHNGKTAKRRLIIK